MNAIEDNPWSQGWRALAATLPRPRAVLCVSAHWVTAGTFVTGQAKPPTIHDFGGFPELLSRVQYPAPGAPEVARRVAEVLGLAPEAALRDDWGLDHGAWSVLRHMWPDADVPVVLLALDGRRPGAEHVALGRTLRPLRDEGVLVLGSGNMTHNLRDAFRHLGHDDVAPPAWAARFDALCARALVDGDAAILGDALASADGRMAHPSPEHYWPLLYVAGAADAGEPVTFPITGFAAGSLSMRAVRIG